MAFCKCGKEIHPKRVSFLEKYKRVLNCVQCAENGTEERVQCYQVITGKTERSIEICDAETAAVMTKLGQRAGTGVSKGVKMNQSFDNKVFSGK